MSERVKKKKDPTDEGRLMSNEMEVVLLQLEIRLGELHSLVDKFVSSSS